MKRKLKLRLEAVRVLDPQRLTRALGGESGAASSVEQFATGQECTFQQTCRC